MFKNGELRASSVLVRKELPAVSLKTSELFSPQSPERKNTGWFSRKAYRARFTGVASGILYGGEWQTNVD